MAAEMVIAMRMLTPARVCCVFKFLRRSVDKKHFTRFQNETSVFNFLHRIIRSLEKKPGKIHDTRKMKIKQK